ncbi:MAG TPA: hypothetical protein VN047_10250 [Sphingopyxis sp.]|uniref:hypothetical protein n=1 Tax=Sphingopyxis sp. TaxID=1908224 RepID=UPI002BA4266F|nr:hypothetical protein [Sphingopyxis sp.]HWW57259.1 hypothetical protein [Sphingopyxis sp.]
MYWNPTFFTSSTSHARGIGLATEPTPDGSRVSTRFTPRYFRLLIDYAKGAPPATAYGDADITPPAITK